MRLGDTNIAKAILVATLGLLVLAPGALADVEPNNSFEQAERVGEGTYTGELSESDPSDFYKIDLNGGQRILGIQAVPKGLSWPPLNSSYPSTIPIELNSLLIAHLPG